MHRVFLSIMPVFTCCFLSNACGGLPNTEGVAFTSGETIHLDKLKQLGVENVNYLSDTQATDNAVRYKSHHDPRVAAFVGSYGSGEQMKVKFNCMGVVLLDSSMKRDTFDFVTAVKTELIWLSSKGIVDISSAAIARIEASLKARRISGVKGDLQYWTHADSTLWGYNCWYDYDTATNKWASAYSCVKSLSKVQCAGISPGSSVPPQAIGTTAVTSKSVIVSKSAPALIVRHLGSGGLIVFLPQFQRSEARVVITDCKGAVVCVKSVPASIHSICINGLAFGRYTARLANN